MLEKIYSIHKILTFKIVSNEGLLNSIFAPLFGSWDIELQGFRSKSITEPDFVVSIDKFNPNNSDCTILDDDYYLKEDYLYCRDHDKYAKWELEVSSFEQGKMEVEIHPNSFGKMFIPELIVHPLIWFKLNEGGYPVIHASAVSRDGKAYIFAAQGAAGKSTIALSLVEKGAKLLTDHFAILSKDEVLSFPTPFHIMEFNLSPILKNNMSSKNKVLFQLRQLFHHLTGKRIPTKILPRDILSNTLLTDKARLNAVFLLLPKEKLKVQSIGKEELIKHLVANQKLEFFPFIKYMIEYSYLFPQSKMATYWTRYEENLRQALDTTEAFYKVEVPLKYDNETLERIGRLVSEC
jgi:hypothetical protein